MDYTDFLKRWVAAAENGDTLAVELIGREAKTHAEALGSTGDEIKLTQRVNDIFSYYAEHN